MNSEILIQSLSNKIEIITKRILTIKKVFYQTSNISLRKRLSNEYSYLFGEFENLKEKVFLLKSQNNSNLSYSSLLFENYSRCEKIIYQNNNLFFV